MLAQVGERKAGGIQTTIDMSQATLLSHASHQEEESMVENHSGWWLSIFGRRNTDDVSDNAPIVIRQNKY